MGCVYFVRFLSPLLFFLNTVCSVFLSWFCCLHLEVLLLLPVHNGMENITKSLARVDDFQRWEVVRVRVCPTFRVNLPLPILH